MLARPVCILRPEPGNARTAAAVEVAGMTALRMPAFAIRALDWTPPDASGFDALLVTSANAVRCAGAGLERLAHLPVIAVGAATAEAARSAGLTVALTGARDADAAIAAARQKGFVRPLHLAGRERTDSTAAIAQVIVYASDPIALPAIPRDAIVLLHSARAARAIADHVPTHDRATIALAAISPTVAVAAGTGWETVRPADTPADTAMIALAHSIAAADRLPRLTI